MKIRIEVSVEIDAPEATGPGRLNTRRANDAIDRAVANAGREVVRLFAQSWGLRSMGVTDARGHGATVTNLDLLA